MKKNKIVGYIRTSKNSQNLGIEVQKEALAKYDIDELYIEQASGRKENREELLKLLASLNRGDTLVVYKIDRLGRSTKQLINITSDLKEKGVIIIFIKEGIDTSTNVGQMLFTIMASIAELEASFISERTKEALAILKQSGVKLGNKGLDEETTAEIAYLYQNTNLTQQQIATKCSVCLKTVYNVKKRNNLRRNHN
ncbi:recombinase family protein [Enterococcus casseliflavus]|nr:recombinase family protein [Enterococcus casseliflavus]